MVANGSNGKMCSLCTIDLNPIVSRDSMLFSLLFDDRVAVKPGIREKNMGPGGYEQIGRDLLDQPSESAKWLGSGPAHSRRKWCLCFSAERQIRAAGARTGSTAQINKI
jgi:hypothetical protein